MKVWGNLIDISGYVWYNGEIVPISIANSKKGVII